MKFAGFKFSFGSFDVKLIDSDSSAHISDSQYGAVSCAKCEFTRPQMFWCHCRHLLCEGCVLSLGNADKTHCVDVLCSICKQATKATLFKLSEAVVSKMLCSCARCPSVLKLGAMKSHLISCYVLNPDSNTEEASAKECAKDSFTTDNTSPASHVKTTPMDGALKMTAFGEESRHADSNMSESRPWYGEYIVALLKTAGFKKCYTSTTIRIDGISFWFAIDEHNVHMIALDVANPRPLKGRVNIFGLGNDPDKTQPLSGLSSKDQFGAPTTGAALRFGAPASLDTIPHVLMITVQLE